MGDTRTIKKKMVDKGRSDFINYAAEILGISKQLLRYKLDSYQEEKDEAEERV